MMKRWLLAVLCIQTLSFAPNETGTGGDPLELAFISRGQTIYSHLVLQKEPSKQLLNAAELEQFRLAIQNTPVSVVERELTDNLGKVVTALTVADSSSKSGRKILLNRSRWIDALTGLKGTYRLVFHEYLWVLGKDDSNYQISQNLDLVEGSTTVTISETVRGPYVTQEQEGKGDRGATRRIAAERYEDYCREWKRSTAERLGNRLVYISCGNRVDMEHFRGGSNKTNDTSIPFDFRPVYDIGYWSESLGTIVIRSDCAVESINERRAGPLLQTSLLSKVGESKAAFAARSNRENFDAVRAASAGYDEMCARWKEDVASQLGARFLHAACDMGGTINIIGSKDKEFNVVYFGKQTAFQFTSTGRVTYCLAP